MKRSLRIATCVTTILLGATFAEGGWMEERAMPRRLREERGIKERQEKLTEERVMTSEEKARREEARARIRARFNKWVVNPVKKLKPRRRPGPPSEEAAAQRRERMKGRFSGIAPRRYPKGQSTDPATGSEPQTNVQPAIYTTEETK